MNEALREWVTNVKDTYYIGGTAAGPHPYPRACARVPVGHRQRDQRTASPSGRPQPRYAHRRRGWWSLMRLAFSTFLDDKDVQIIGVENGWVGP